MATEEAGCCATDMLVGVELVECGPAPDAADVRVVSANQQPPDAFSPVQRAAEATIAQTGADPPPAVTRG